MTTEGGFAFVRLLRELETQLVEVLALRPVMLSPTFAQHEGRWRGEPVRLRARAYESPLFGLARFVEISSNRLELGNLLCVSRPDHSFPVFGVDLVDTGGGQGVVVADLSPMNGDPHRNEEFIGSLLARRRGTEALPSGGPLPDWAARWFSPAALFARIQSANADKVWPAVQPFVAALGAMVRVASEWRVPPGGENDVALSAQRYLQAHRDEDRTLRLLDKIFGEEWARGFVHEVLFPLDRACARLG